MGPIAICQSQEDGEGSLATTRDFKGLLNKYLWKPKIKLIPQVLETSLR